MHDFSIQKWHLLILVIIDILSLSMSAYTIVAYKILKFLMTIIY